MPRDERVLTVFVASPSDLDPERSRLEEVIHEFNTSWSHTSGARLDLVRWETHGYPGVGQDAQEVLNRQLPDDCDIFVGLMWAKFGTPTGRAGSGTEEEFLRAHKRFQENPNAVKIMFYFKDAPVAPSTIDPEQVAKVQRFRASLGKEGVLYWNFGTIEDFGKLVQLHLTRQFQDFTGGRGVLRTGATAKPGGLAPPAEEDDLGLLDLLDLLEESSSQLTEIAQRINDETLDLANRIEERSQEIAASSAQAQGQLSRPEAKRLIEKAAFDMNRYVAHLKTELPLFREMTGKSADAAARAALMTVAIGSKDRKQVQDARNGLAGLAKALGFAHESITTFRTTVGGLPRLTAALNRAKREVVAVLDEVLITIADGRRVILEALKTVDASVSTGGGTI
jgi:hypothetical protein